MMKESPATHHDYWYALVFSINKQSKLSQLNYYITACTWTTIKPINCSSGVVMLGCDAEVDFQPPTI